MRSLVSKIRYNYFVSLSLVGLLKPVFMLGSYLVRIISNKVKVNGKVVFFEGNKIVFPPNIGIGINSKIYWNGMKGFEPLTSKTLLFFFKGYDVFFDIGSNFGFYSVLAQRINKQIKVFCFEPLPNIYDDNVTFHRVNKVFNQVVNEIALSEKEGTVPFFVPNVYGIDSEITSSSLEEGFFYNLSFNKKEITVKTTTLDKFVSDKMPMLQDKRIIMKIDVEGHERAVLKGGIEFLKALKPVIVMEIDKNAENINALWPLLVSVNYSVYAITSVGYFKLSLSSFLGFKGGRDFLLISTPFSSREYISFDLLGEILISQFRV